MTNTPSREHRSRVRASQAGSKAASGHVDGDAGFVACAGCSLALHAVARTAQA